MSAALQRLPSSCCPLWLREPGPLFREKAAGKAHLNRRLWESPGKGLRRRAAGRQPLRLCSSPISVQLRSAACHSTHTEVERLLSYHMMTDSPRPKVSLGEACLEINGDKILTNVPPHVVITEDHHGGGFFLGATADDLQSVHSFRLGMLRSTRFLCCFRFKLWWMTQRTGDRGAELPAETQFLLLESVNQRGAGRQALDRHVTEGTQYVVVLPVLDGSFRASLSGNAEDEVILTCQSEEQENTNTAGTPQLTVCTWPGTGDPDVRTSQCPRALYVHSGPNPFEVINEAVLAVESQLKTFARREMKKLPGILDHFGWCTWNAFYTDVSVDGVHKGLESLAAGETPAKFLIIDDGWQSIAADNGSSEPAAVVTAGTQYASRLADIRENAKFQQLRGAAPNSDAVTLAQVVQELKEEQALKYVYVWHALMGYWGGVQAAEGPASRSAMDPYRAAITYPLHTADVLANNPDMAMDSLTVNGVGLVHPEMAFDFYNTMHTYLREAGIDGVKVDAQAILETLGAGHGGRLKLAKVYYQALEASVAQNFPDNGIIACMSHGTDGLYSAKQTAVVRASDDFWPLDPASHAIHIASVVYNSLFLGEFMQPDWDMFYSSHPAAEFHAAARAVGGCAVYVSDEPGQHDFSILKKLVLPDGSVLRCRLPGRPTRDSLFVDPARDETSMLKVWNLNLFTGVLGAFNCQGSGWCKVGKKYAIHNMNPAAVSGGIRAADVDGLAQLAGVDWQGEAVLYAHRNRQMTRLAPSDCLLLTLDALEYEVYTVAPLKTDLGGADFAPIGLINMFNAGGAIKALEYSITQTATTQAAGLADSGGCAGLVHLGVSGGGVFAAFVTVKPCMCSVDDVEVTFDYESECLTMPLPFLPGHTHSIIIQI